MDKFGKIRRHHWKERYKINKIAKFESDLLKTYEDIALQTFVWWGAGGGGKFVPLFPHTNVCNFSTLRRYIFISFQQVTFKFGNFPNFKALFSVVSTDFSKRVHVKIWLEKIVLMREPYKQSEGELTEDN